MTRHETIRLRHETRRRTLTVATLDPITPRMLRIGFTCPDLADFVSAAPDDHIKLIFGLPPGAAADAKPLMRDFTPRKFDTAAGTITIDFALHDEGPATSWARHAKTGDTLTIGGPRGSVVVPDDFDWYLLVGDETALPAIGRKLEELRPDVPVTTVAVVEDEREIQDFPPRPGLTPVWVLRSNSGTDDGESLKSALARFTPPAGDGFVWVAAEASAARAVRGYMVEECAHPKAWVKASGYWRRGEAEIHEKIED